MMTIESKLSPEYSTHEQTTHSKYSREIDDEQMRAAYASTIKCAIGVVVVACARKYTCGVFWWNLALFFRVSCGYTRSPICVFPFISV